MVDLPLPFSPHLQPALLDELRHRRDREGPAVQMHFATAPSPHVRGGVEARSCSRCRSWLVEGPGPARARDDTLAPAVQMHFATAPSPHVRGGLEARSCSRCRSWLVEGPGPARARDDTLAAAVPAGVAQW